MHIFARIGSEFVYMDEVEKGTSLLGRLDGKYSNHFQAVTRRGLHSVTVWVLNEWAIEWVSVCVCVCEWVCTSVSVWVCTSVSECVSQWARDRASVRRREHRWVSEREIEHQWEGERASVSWWARDRARVSEWACVCVFARVCELEKLFKWHLWMKNEEYM